MGRARPRVSLVYPAARPIQMRYTDPETGKQVRVSTGTRDPVKAEEERERLQAKLILGLDVQSPRKRVYGPGMPWEDFRDEYSRQHLSTLRLRSRNDVEFRLDMIERILSPSRLRDVATREALEQLQSDLLAGVGSRKKRARSRHTVRSYMVVIRTALLWAEERGWLPSVPRVRGVKTSKLKHAKGRPLATEEFERMLECVPKVVGDAAAPSWDYLLRGLWESGLRLNEAMSMSWTDPQRIHPDWRAGRHPLLMISPSEQKNDTEDAIPLLPGFERLLLETPEAERDGWVFSPEKRNGTGRPTAEWVGRVISRIGKAAGVVVDRATGKYASAHDLRRSLADRLEAAGVPERTISRIMRHASVETTRRYYATGNVQREAASLKMYLGTHHDAQEEAVDANR